MLPVTETVFWICFSIILYTYAGYPLLLRFIVFIKDLVSPLRINNKIYVPVTLIVPAYNEESIIEEKIRNCMSLDYPAELLHIIFVTDGSIDDTSSVIKKYPGILHLHEDVRRGKLAAINRAMLFAKTDIVIFTDANTMLNREGILKIVAHYTHKKVGAVSGEKRILTSNNEAVTQGEGLYWKYESWIKRLDSRLYTVVGAAGELFSLRRNLYTALPESTIIEDFVQSLLICTKGYVVRYEPEAYSLEKASDSVEDEMERKIRISAGGFQAMAYLKNLFNILRFPLVSFQYISHRVLRWTLCPIALISMFAASVVLAVNKSPLFIYLCACQLVFYVVAALGLLMSKKDRCPALFYLPFYFVLMNFCVFAGFWRYINGAQSVTWRKARR
jgi:biofilm PGA synthesis N-glycosyltransferase PgaC